MKKSRTRTKLVKCIEQEHSGIESVGMDGVLLERLDALQYMVCILPADYENEQNLENPSWMEESERGVRGGV